MPPGDTELWSILRATRAALAIRIGAMPTLTVWQYRIYSPRGKGDDLHPDDLLERLDAQRATPTAETRSGFLQRLAERELSGERDDAVRRRKTARRSLGPPVTTPAATRPKLIREDRESH